MPVALRGRVLGAITAGAWAAIPIGVIAAGFLLERIGLRPVFLASGVLYIAAMLALSLNPATREMEVPAPQLISEAASKVA